MSATFPLCEEPPAGPKRAGRSAVSGRGLRLLVVDDERVQRRILAEILEGEGWVVETAGSLEEAAAAVGRGGLDLVLTDLKMPGGSGLELLERVKRDAPDVEVVLMTAFSSVETAVDAMRKGAFHYLPKPFTRDDLLGLLNEVGDRAKLRRENRELRGLVSDRFRPENMLGRSPGMQEVFRTVEKVCSDPATVLIRGESGTGKELVARAIHLSGKRRERPFVAINCAAIPETLVESELFGHEKGAFTGAHGTKVGRFEEVCDGTLFLDEIGSMHLDLQSKLLRVIQEREFQRVGGRRMLRFEGRIVAATSEDLEARIRDNRFRADLYYRLNVVPIAVPPLRERRDDLPLLVDHFVRKHAAESGKSVRSLGPEALDLLEAHDWPGNVRELENVIQRMVVLAAEEDEVLGPESVPAEVARRDGHAPDPPGVEVGLAGRAVPAEGAPGDGAPRPRGTGGDPFVLPPDGVRLADVEASLIRQALERSGGRLEPASRWLGISYKTLQYRIKKYGLR